MLVAVALSARAQVSDDRLGTRLGAFPDLETGEATQHQLLPNLGRVVFEQVLDRLLVVADVRLVEQDHLLVVVLQLALDDPLDDVLGLALGLLGVDLPLAVEFGMEGVERLADPVRRARRGQRPQPVPETVPTTP